MIALVAAANGANINIHCWTGTDVKVTLSTASESFRKADGVMEVNLWLAQPPPPVADRLRSAQTRVNFQPRAVFIGMLPVLGGASEVSRFVSNLLNCKPATDEETLALWNKGLKAGRSCSWIGRMSAVEPALSLAYCIEADFLGKDIHMPASLAAKAAQHFKAPRGDIRHALARKAASVFHEVVNYPEYESIDGDRLEAVPDFAIIAIFTGCMGRLASNATDMLDHYAWTAECKRFKGFAESAILQGLTLNRILMAAARIWGGVPPAFAPDIASGAMIMGIACPQTTILVNVLSHPDMLALHGTEGGIFILHQGSIPTIPRNNTGLILAGTKRVRAPVSSLDARDVIQSEPQFDRALMSTVEIVTGNDGVFAALLCAWQYGDVVLELNPYHVLCGLTGQRALSRSISGLSRQPEPTSGAPALTHIGDRELLSYTEGFTIRGGLALVRTGPRLDLQIAAAGCHFGLHTIMITSPDDARLIRSWHRFLSVPRIAVLDIDDNTHLKDGTVLIFCLDNLPPHVGDIIDWITEAGC